jgi:hypothetical protein
MAAVLLRQNHALDLRQQSALLLWQRSTVLAGMKENGAPPLIGHGVRAKRSKSGAVSFDVLETEISHAAVQ